MTYDIFTDEKEKAEARKALKDLIDHPGWQFVVRALQANAQHFRQRLLTDPEFENLAEVRYLQQRISDLECYEDLPDRLLASIPIEQDPEDEEDIYPQ